MEAKVEAIAEEHAAELSALEERFKQAMNAARDRAERETKVEVQKAVSLALEASEQER